MLCRYRNVFGVPKTGVHAHRILRVAAIDLALTIAAAAVIAKITKVRFVTTFLILMLLAMALHRLFCVNTALNVLFFGKV